MAKTQEELNKIKEEVETLNKKLSELTVEELEQVSGGGENTRCLCPRGYSEMGNYCFNANCGKKKFSGDTLSSSGNIFCKVYNQRKRFIGGNMIDR